MKIKAFFVVYFYKIQIKVADDENDNSYFDIVF